MIAELVVLGRTSASVPTMKEEEGKPELKEPREGAAIEWHLHARPPQQLDGTIPKTGEPALAGEWAGEEGV